MEYWSSLIFMIILVALIVGPLLLIIAAFFVGCFERSATRSFEDSEPNVLPDYLNAMLLQGSQYGFDVCCYGYHVKYKQNVTAAVMLSFDMQILSVISEGTIARMPLKKTLLFSQLVDGRVLITTDEYGVGEMDKLSERQILANGDFQELVLNHRERLRNQRVKPFPANASWSTFDQLNMEKYERLRARGLIRFADAEKKFVTYTVIGSFRTTIIGAAKQIINPRNFGRSTRRRPGSIPANPKGFEVIPTKMAANQLPANDSAEPAPRLTPPPLPPLGRM